MKLVHGFVGLLLLLVIVVACVISVNAARSDAEWLKFSELVGGSRIAGAGAAVGMICLLAVFVLSGFRPRERERFLSFRNEGGTVSISTVAISEYICKLAAEFPSIVKMYPRVVPGRNCIDIVIDVRIKAGPQIHEVCEVLQGRVRENLATGLGISEVRRVEVSVRQISPEHRSV